MSASHIRPLISESVCVIRSIRARFHASSSRREGFNQNFLHKPPAFVLRTRRMHLIALAWVAARAISVLIGDFEHARNPHYMGISCNPGK